MISTRVLLFIHPEATHHTSTYKGTARAFPGPLDRCRSLKQIETRGKNRVSVSTRRSSRILTVHYASSSSIGSALFTKQSRAYHAQTRPGV